MVRKSIFMVAVVSFLAQPVVAQSTQEASIENEFANFSAGLDTQSQDMQAIRNSNASNAANVNLTNMQANQDTENAANQAFQNGQEQMINGGGAYNSQGFIWGSPWGGMGGYGGGGSALGSNMVPNLPSTSWSGQPQIRGPREGYNGVLRSYYGSGAANQSNQAGQSNQSRRWSIGN